MNHINKIRSEILTDFKEESFQEGDSDTFISPCGKFKVNTINVWSKDPSWNLTRVQIDDQKNGKQLFNFFVNDDRFFHEWLNKENVDYLVCAEDVFGGQTIIDLTNKKLVGYSPDEDGFIWTDFHLSPNGKKLATVGCYWAWPFVIKVFDFSEPMNLPLKEVEEIELLDNDEIILGWIDNNTLKTKGVKREREPEYSEVGMRMVTVSEEEVEREINVK
jgi:hypothetical protein